MLEIAERVLIACSFLSEEEALEEKPAEREKASHVSQVFQARGTATPQPKDRCLFVRVREDSVGKWK